MRKVILLLTFLLSFTSCSSIYQAIVHTNKFYSPVQHAVFVEEAPEGSIYVGTVKIVPHDNSNPFSDDIIKAKAKMLEAAAEAGAKYVVITNFQKPTSDYRTKLDWDYGDGINLIGEMYR